MLAVTSGPSTVVTGSFATGPTVAVSVGMVCESVGCAYFKPGEPPAVVAHSVTGLRSVTLCMSLMVPETSALPSFEDTLSGIVCPAPVAVPPAAVPVSMSCFGATMCASGCTMGFVSTVSTASAAGVVATLFSGLVVVLQIFHDVGVVAQGPPIGHQITDSSVLSVPGTTTVEITYEPGAIDDKCAVPETLCLGATVGASTVTTHRGSVSVGTQSGVATFDVINGVVTSVYLVLTYPGSVGMAAAPVTPPSVRTNARTGSTSRRLCHPREMHAAEGGVEVLEEVTCCFPVTSVPAPVVPLRASLNAGSDATSTPLAFTSNVSHFAVTASASTGSVYGPRDVYLQARARAGGAAVAQSATILACDVPPVGVRSLPDVPLSVDTGVVRVLAVAAVPATGSVYSQPAVYLRSQGPRVRAVPVTGSVYSQPAVYLRSQGPHVRIGGELFSQPFLSRDM